MVSTQIGFDIGIKQKGKTIETRGLEREFCGPLLRVVVMCLEDFGVSSVGASLCSSTKPARLMNAYASKHDHPHQS